MEDMNEIHTFDHTEDGEGWKTAVDAMTQLGLDVEGVCEKRGWQEDDFRNTFLGAVFIQIDPAEDQAEVFSEVCWISPLPLPGFVVEDLAYHLPRIAAGAEKGVEHWSTHWSDNVVPIACVASFEGWTLDVQPDEMTAEQKWAMANGAVHTLPERIEERLVMMCLYDGTVVTVDRRRGGEPRVDVVRPNSEELKLRGRIPVAMRELTKAVVGVLWEGGD